MTEVGETIAPRGIAGERACPPEDCGGTWGYEDLLEALTNAKHDQHEDLREWAGDDWTPEAFDVDAGRPPVRSAQAAARSSGADGRAGTSSMQIRRQSHPK